MKTYTKRDFHNPEQLTRQQVGEQYRLLLPEEVDGRFSRSMGGCGELCIVEYNEWLNRSCSSENWTYRVPLATPLPDGTVLTSNECCFSGELYSLDGGFCTNDIRKRVYICGPMSSHPDDFNFPAFFKASEELEKQGYEAVNPAQMDLDCGWTLEELKELDVGQFQVFLKGAVKRDLDAIQTCQAIAMLPGWESSKGAKAELAVAQWLGLDVIYLKGDAPTEPKEPRMNDCGKIDMGDYSSTSTAQYAPDDPKGAAGAKKAPMWLLPASAMRETAWVHKHGADKYGPFNWREGSVCSSTYISAIMRHLDLWRDGEDNDAESGRSHLASIAASCNILMDAMQCGTLRDDRNKLK